MQLPGGDDSDRFQDGAYYAGLQEDEGREIVGARCRVAWKTDRASLDRTAEGGCSHMNISHGDNALTTILLLCAGTGRRINTYVRPNRSLAALASTASHLPAVPPNLSGVN